MGWAGGELWTPLQLSPHHALLQASPAGPNAATLKESFSTKRDEFVHFSNDRL